MPFHTMPVLIERRSAGEGREYFVTRTGRRPWLKVIDVPVPAFTGDKAWFEVDTTPGWPWRVLRQVEGPMG